MHQSQPQNTWVISLAKHQAEHYTAKSKQVQTWFTSCAKCVLDGATMLQATMQAQ
jgi:hypothetical protein